MQDNSIKKLITIISIATLLSGCIEHGNGMQSGICTGITTRGILIKTTRAYIQTGTNASQSFSYCVEDSGLISKLELASEQQKSVTVYYHREVFMMPWRCNGEKQIIDKVVL